MDNSRSLVPDAHVRSLVIVEADELSNPPSCVAEVTEAIDTVHELILDYAICPLGNRVVRRAVVLRHTYECVMFFQESHVIVAAILRPPVRMMYDASQVLAVRLIDGHLQSLYRMYSHE